MLTVAAALTLARATPAVAQDDAAVDPPAAELSNSNSTTDAERARLLGMLTYRRVSVDFSQTPAREAFATLRRLARIPLVVRWTDDAVGMGIDPELPITYSGVDQPVREALEAMLDLCAAGAAGRECTWQLRRGFIEAGTKERLSVPAAREMRLYEIRDMMIEAPDFSSDDNGRVRMFRDQIDPQHAGQRARPDDQGTTRKSPQALAVELVQEICETIEPGHWDYGQEIETDRDDDARVEPRPVGTATSSPAGATDSGSGATDGGADAAPAEVPAQATTPTPRRFKGIGMWATIRLWRDQLIVVAPDFVHRQIGGYPKAIVPDDVDPASIDLPEAQELEP